MDLLTNGRKRNPAASSTSAEDRPDVRAVRPSGGVDAAGSSGPDSTMGVGLAASWTAIVGRIRAPRRFRCRPAGVWLYTGRSVAGLLAVVVLAAFGVNWRILDRTNAGLAANAVAAINTQDPNIVRAAPTTTSASTPPTSTTASTPRTTSSSSAGSPVPAVAPTKTYTAENILLLGSDTRANGNANAGNSDGNQTTAQSDTLMIAHLSADRQHVSIVSIPRDTKVDAPTCKIWNSTTGKVSNQTEPVNPGDRWKITNAYAVGGPTCTVAAVQKLTGLQIDRMLGIDFNGFKAMVDALGGITVNICKPIVDAELQTIAPSAGVQVIHGDQALSLVRARMVIGDQQSDLARIHRQQIVLSTILRQVSSAGTLLNPAKLDNFLQAFVKNTFTANITSNDLVALADSLGNLSPARVTFYTMPTVPDADDLNSLVLDDTKAPAVLAALRNDTPLPGQAPAHPTQPQPRTLPVTGSHPAAVPTVASSKSPPPASADSKPSPPPASSNSTGLSGVNAGTNTCL